MLATSGGRRSRSQASGWSGCTSAASAPGGRSSTRSTRTPGSSSATLAAAAWPGASLSGHMNLSVRRPASGAQSAFATASAPPGQATQTMSGNSHCAASAGFSPSQTITGASGRAASLSRP